MSVTNANDTSDAKREHKFKVRRPWQSRHYAHCPQHALAF